MHSDGFVRTEDLSKVYSSGRIQVVALDRVNLSIPRGCFLGVTGTSGSGKSTLMNLLGGLDTPSMGEIHVQDKRISEFTSDDLALYRRHQVGMIFQAFNIIPSYTALENVALPLFFSDVTKHERRCRAEEMLAKVKLHPRKDHRPAELSGGEQQRVAIARALINRPNILLADEPTGNLDSQTSREIVEILSELNRRQGLTVIMISHEEQLLAEYADEMIRLKDGHVVGQEEGR